MKKIFTYCCALLLAGGVSGVSAEKVLINEDFESRIFPAEGWNIIDNHTEGIDEETGKATQIERIMKHIEIKRPDNSAS